MHILLHGECIVAHKKYTTEIKISDTVVLKIWVGKIGTKSFDFRCRLVGQGAAGDAPSTPSALAIPPAGIIV